MALDRFSNEQLANADDYIQTLYADGQITQAEFQDAMKKATDMNINATEMEQLFSRAGQNYNDFLNTNTQTTAQTPGSTTTTYDPTESDTYTPPGEPSDQAVEGTRTIEGGDQFSYQTTDQQQTTAATVLDNYSDPEIAEQGIQTYTRLDEGPEYEIDKTDEKLYVADTTTRSIDQVDEDNLKLASAPEEIEAATMKATHIGAENAPKTKIASASTQGIEVDAVQRKLTFDQLVATQDLTEEELMTTQMDELMKGLEGGNVPNWAKPAVAAAESMLRARGMDPNSSVGRDALFNAVIQSAMPIAQQMSQDLQRRSSQNLNNQQQSNIAYMSHLANMDITNANNAQQAAIATANNFLQTNIANLQARQQAYVADQQATLQILMADQAADNLAAQVNAQNKQSAINLQAQLVTQVDMFNSNLISSVEQFNVSQTNAMTQFYDQMDLQRETFNSTMYKAIQDSNVTWRRQANTIDTAGINATNQANAMNYFNVSQQSLAWMWGDLRDSATWAFQQSQSEFQRDTSMALAALANEANKDLWKMKIDGDEDATFWSTLGQFVNNMLGYEAPA